MTTARPDKPAAAPPSAVRRAAAEFWLNALFWQSRHAPFIGKSLRQLAIHGSFRWSHFIRGATLANAPHILGPRASIWETERYAKGVLGSFFDFVNDVGRCADMTDAELRAQIASIDGGGDYEAARAAGKGAIIATAHMGSFEAAAAALLEREKKLHVVFKRDQRNRFEEVRSDLRKRLGVIEAPIDDGWTIWLRLREALLRDEVVMLQADRVMPGQKGIEVPFLFGRLAIPTGPIKLALASSAPIIPIFSLRAPDGKVRVKIEPAIWVGDCNELPHPALLQLAGILEKYVRAYPQQWLLLHRAFQAAQSEEQRI